MGLQVTKLDFRDKVRFFFTVFVPELLRGLLVPNRYLLGTLVKLNAGHWSVRTVDLLRQKYHSDLFWVPFIFKRTLLVLDATSMQAVLTSGENQADPPLKKKALSKFVPDAVIISKGTEWKVRRRFNKDVLGLGRPHRHADAFADVISAEVDQLAVHASAGELLWTDFRRLARGISQKVILGSGDMDWQLVESLVFRCNWPLPKHRDLDVFYRNIERSLDSHRTSQESASHHCLMQDSVEHEDAPALRMPRQIGFWVFVLKDALELHVPRTLALIAAHPRIQERARQEVTGNSIKNVAGIARLDYLERCVKEQMRLWTAVPLLLRRATARFRLRDEVEVQREQQLMLYPSYYHRDRWVFGHVADQFCPDSVERLPPVFYFSAGQQECAGQDLALFLIKATLASLLARSRFELIGPRLNPARIPYLYNHYRIRFRMTPGS